MIGRSRLSLSVLATILLVQAFAPCADAQTTSPASPGCDQPCLAKVMNDFIAAMTHGKAATVPLVAQAEVRENTRVVSLEQTTWAQVKAVRSILTFADPLSGNIVSRAGVELPDAKPAYLSTRLKVGSDGRITDVEISADVSPRVVASYVWSLDPLFMSVLPPEQRLSRVELEALGRRYFHSLSTHQAVAHDFDDGSCNRFHSGQQITNVTRNTVESGPARTCASSLEGDVPWGPATDLRIPVVDPERGIVFGITLLHYLKNQPARQMYVSEVFKVVGGRIVTIDNIGLMMEGVTTQGFVH
jgi:hypothetical protein